MFTITKQEFERTLYVATSSHMEVFDSVEPYIESAAMRVERDILGGIEITDDGTLKLLKAYISLEAFLAVFRQLDLVLTPTGFGVVANQTTSPASKARVDSLEAQLLLQDARTRGALLLSLTQTEGWGRTMAARQTIQTIFYDIHLLELYSRTQIDFATWQAAQTPVMEMDITLRRKISAAQMEELLDHLRNNTLTGTEQTAVALIREIFALYIGKSPMVREHVRNLINYLEGNPTDFKTYIDSDAYKLNHHEQYENTKDKPAFFFVG